MKQAVIYGCFTGHGILFLCIFLLGIRAVPTPKPASASDIPDIATKSSINSTAEVTSSKIETQNISLAHGDFVQEQQDTNRDPPSIINNKNVTETEIVITEARHGKSLHNNHRSNNQPDLIKKTEGNSNLTEENVQTDLSSSDFTVKLATDDEHEVHQLSDGDAPPKNDTRDNPERKSQGLQEPQLISIQSTDVVLTERDKMIRRIFGGECNFSHWHRCSRIEFWGGDYLVPDKNNPGKFIVRNHKIRCAERPKSTICLKNGWTVERCHMLCMSQCNVEYRMSYEKLVLHEGDCKLPLLLK